MPALAKLSVTTHTASKAHRENKKRRIFIAYPGEARGCSIKTVVIKQLLISLIESSSSSSVFTAPQVKPVRNDRKSSKTGYVAQV